MPPLILAGKWSYCEINVILMCMLLLLKFNRLPSQAVIGSIFFSVCEHLFLIFHLCFRCEIIVWINTVWGHVRQLSVIQRSPWRIFSSSLKSAAAEPPHSTLYVWGLLADGQRDICNFKPPNFKSTDLKRWIHQRGMPCNHGNSITSCQCEIWA